MDRGDFQAQHGDPPRPRAGKTPGRRQKTRPEPEAPIILLAKLLRHFFPDWKSAFAKLEDPRDPVRVLYPKEHLVWSGILMFMMHLGFRRQFRHERDSPVFAENLQRLCGHKPLGTVADPDTLDYYAFHPP